VYILEAYVTDSILVGLSKQMKAIPNQHVYDVPRYSVML